MALHEHTVLICPKNDEESLMILKLAHAAGIPTIEITQPHGARFEKETDIIPRIMETDPDAQTLVVVELPGPRMEELLEGVGYKVVIIDHHRYDDVDRMQEKSSLEQFRDYFGIDDTQVAALGFNPRMVEAVGVIDRGFVWELKREGFIGEDFQEALKFYRLLTLELGEKRRLKEEALAQEAWEEKREQNGVLIVKTEDDFGSIRDAVSFLVAAAYPEHPPQTVVIQGTRRMYVQESPHAKELHDRFGGFTFGKDECWGILKDDGNLPLLDEVLHVIVK